MAFQSVPNVVEAVPLMLINAQPITMTFYGLAPLGYDQAMVDELAVQMDDWAGTELIPMLSNQAAYISTTVRGLENPIDLFALNSTSAGVGGDASAPLSNNTCFAVKRTSGFTGRSARGRVYFPCTAGYLSTNEDFLASSAANNIVAALNQVRAYMLLATFTEVIVSRYTAGAPRPSGVTLPVVEYAYKDLRVDTQRRRLPGA